MSWSEVGMMIGLLFAMCIGVYVFFNISSSLIEQPALVSSENLTNNLDITFSPASISQFGEASGIITTLSSVGDSYMVNFKDDLSDYQFTGVDSTELYFLQYAFEHNESVTVSYTTENEKKILEGVTLSSPEPVITPSETVEPDVGIDWWIYAPLAIGPAVAIALFLSQHRRERDVDEMINSLEERLITSVPEQEDQLTMNLNQESRSSSRKKKEPKEKVVLPLDSRYRVERAEKLLGEKDKEKKIKKKEEREK